MLTLVLELGDSCFAMVGLVELVRNLVRLPESQSGLLIPRVAMRRTNKHYVIPYKPCLITAMEYSSAATHGLIIRACRTALSTDDTYSCLLFFCSEEEKGCK